MIDISYFKNKENRCCDHFEQRRNEDCTDVDALIIAAHSEAQKVKIITDNDIITVIKTPERPDRPIKVERLSQHLFKKSANL